MLRTAGSRVLIQWLLGVACVLSADEKSYRAAVLEHVRFGDLSHPPQEIVKRNLDVYETATKTAAAHNVDIIVFPECGLYPCEKAVRSTLQTFVEDIPDPRRSLINPCKASNAFKEHPILKRLSCMAKDYGLFLVVNFLDIKHCASEQACDADGFDPCPTSESTCPEDKILLYNTNLVFNREGTLITKYYKKHLYFEKAMNTASFEQDGFFETDFGRFTTVICFDLVFKESVQEVERHKVTNLAYPTYWYDHLPYVFFSTPYQQAWAMRNKVNLLAANCHEPRTGTLGSGLFSADRGALIYTHNPDVRTKLLISSMPRSFDNSDFQANPLRFYVGQNGEVEEGELVEDRDYEKVCGTHVLGQAAESSAEYRCHPPSSDYVAYTKLENKEGEVNVCSGTFCCSLRYSANSMNENYYLGISKGETMVESPQLYGMQTCFLARCDSLGQHVCADYVLQSHTVFRRVALTANFKAKYVYPFALDSEVRLTDRKLWTFDGTTSISYQNSNKISSLIFLGLFGRMYEIDKVVDLS